MTVVLLPHVHARRQQHPPQQPRDLYKVLGVDRSCGDQELKKAYRKAALRAHPDKPTGSEDEFKQVNQAYEVLSNPEERARYDQFGHMGVGGGGGAAENPFAEGFSGSGGNGFSFHTNMNGNHGGAEFAQFAQQFARQHASGGRQQQQQQHGFGSGGNTGSFGLDDWIRQMMMGGGAAQGSRTRRPPRALKEVTRTLSCSLADLFLGKTKTVTLQIHTHTSSSRRHQAQPQQYIIHLKPGWKAGTKIKFPQRGRDVPPITFIIHEAKHATLERRDNDLVYRHKLAPQNNRQNKRRKRKRGKDDDIQPVKLSITLPNGHVWQRTVPAEKVPRLMKAGECLIVPDLGMPIKDTNERGNLIIEFY